MILQNIIEVINRNIKEINPFVKTGSNNSFKCEIGKDNPFFEIPSQVEYKQTLFDFGESIENITVIQKELNIWMIEFEKKLKEFESTYAKVSMFHDHEKLIAKYIQEFNKNVYINSLMRE